MELNVENRGALPVSVERKSIRIVTPEGQDVYPVSPLGVGNCTRGQAMIGTGSDVLDAVQLVFGLARLAQNYDVAAKWDHLMPEAFKVAPTEERRMLLALRFQRPTSLPDSGALNCLSMPVPAPPARTIALLEDRAAARQPRSLRAW